MMAKLVEETFGKVVQTVDVGVVGVVGVGVGNSSPGTDCSSGGSIIPGLVIAVWSVTSKFARIFSRNFSSVVVLGIVGGAMATKV